MHRPRAVGRDSPRDIAVAMSDRIAKLEHELAPIA
jgi:hypothetical protein